MSIDKLPYKPKHRTFMVLHKIYINRPPFYIYKKRNDNIFITETTGEYVCLIQLILENTNYQAYKKYCMILK